MTRSVTPPPLQGPSSKEKKYDRQLRLWAASGQEALEEAHVLLVNSGPGVVGVEALKNLILPGIGNFTIVDDAIVTEADLGVNFFLEEDSLGQSRARECCKLLLELNPDVTGHHILQPVETLLEQPDFLKNYSHILVSAPIRSATLSRISQYAWEHSIPLFYIHSIGFYSQFSVQLPAQYPIVDTHPDPTSTQDLRLLSPWPELSAYVAEKCDKLDTLSDHDHGHVPYLLLLLHYLEKWKASHDGEYPENYKEKTVFREMVRRGARVNNPEGGEENFDEAIGAVLKSLNPHSLSSGIREVLSAEESKNPTSQSPNFWLIAHAIHLFHQTHALLPLPGSVPDMKAQSSDYIRLQNIYKTRARHDEAEILHTVRAAEKRLGRKTAIDEKEIEAFCKNGAFVKLIHGRVIQIADEDMRWEGDRANVVLGGREDPESLAPIAVAFLAYDRFWDEHGRAPGLDSSPRSPPPSRAHASSSPAHADHDAMVKYAHATLHHALQPTTTQPPTKASPTPAALSVLPTSPATTTSTTNPPQIPEPLTKAITELLRAQGCELHNISALTGGMVAQEVIKVVTKQYVPVAGGCVFDGVGSRSWCF